MKVYRHIDGSTHGGKHLHLNVAYGVDAVGTQSFQHMGRAWVTMTRVRTYFEMAVGRNKAFFAGFTQGPKQTFIIDKKTAHPKTCTTTDLLDTTGNLFFATQTITHTLTFFSLYRSGGVGSGTRATGQNKLHVPFLGIFHHLFDFIIRKEHNTLGLGDTMDLDAIFIQSFKQGLHRARALNAGNFKTILASVREAFF